jgi:hypothetical protein
VDFSNCGNPATVAINGAVGATNISHTGTLGSPPFTLNVSYTFNLIFTYNNGAKTVATMGKFDVNANAGGTLTISLSNGELGTTTGGNSVVLTNLSESRTCSSYNSSTYVCNGILTTSSSFTVGGTVSNGTVTVTTLAPLEIDLANGATVPYAGALLIGGAGSNLRITINDDDVAINGASSPDLVLDIDTDGNMAVWEFTQNYEWTTIF